MTLTDDSSFQERIGVGRPHEVSVRDRLPQHGWDVQDFGQGVLTERLRSAWRFKEPKIMWRWIPDLVAAKGSQVVLIDPKSGLRDDTDNFAVEMSAWMSHMAMLPLGLPIIYVFSDFTCNTPERLRPVGWITPRDPRRTPFVLVRKADQRPFEWAFGEAMS